MSLDSLFGRSSTGIDSLENTEEPLTNCEAIRRKICSGEISNKIVIRVEACVWDRIVDSKNIPAGTAIKGIGYWEGTREESITFDVAGSTQDLDRALSIFMAEARKDQEAIYVEYSVEKSFPALVWLLPKNEYNLELLGDDHKPSNDGPVITITAYDLEPNRHDSRWIKMTKPPKLSGNTVIKTVDLFAGCGGLVLGTMEACRRMGLNHRIEFANEWDKNALGIFVSNLKPVKHSPIDITKVFDGDLSDKNKTTAEMEFLDTHPDAYAPDLLTGGPPCQGFSDLNNHSRRNDSRNNLYLRMVRAAQVLEPKAIIIENVSTVIHAVEKVVDEAKQRLVELGYNVVQTILWAHEFGVPQKRKRHFLIASKNSVPDLTILDAYRRTEPRTLRWAIEDLQGEYTREDWYNNPARSNETNQERMNWLIENDEFDLPNELRPKCHQNGHNYPAVYGRMKWDEPSSTITAGFRSNGQGRFTHPSAYPGRPLTPHEGARIQTFPDWFSFEGQKPTTMAKTIGNAVPPLLGMYVAKVAIRSIID